MLTEKRILLNMKRIEIKILVFACLIFWLFQLFGEEHEKTFLIVLSAITVIAIIIADKCNKFLKTLIYSLPFQIFALFFMRLFSLARKTNLFEEDAIKDILLELLLVFILFSVLIVFNRKFVKTVRKSKINLVYIVMGVGFFIRELLCYVAGYMALQNDLMGFDAKSDGHLAYIYRIYKFTSLPSGSPENRYQFYQPPFHHIISGMWAKLNHFLGVEEGRLCEMLQVIALFYSVMIIILAYKIMKEITKNKRSILIGVVLVTFFPYLMEYSGSINNDPLCFVLSLAAVLFFIRWYKKSTYKNIILCAVCLGLAMMTKLSAFLLAPAMAILFLYKLVKEKTHVLNYIKQYLVFGVISIPLGIWFPLKNSILYGIPLNYVTVTPAAYHIDKSISTFTRLFGFSMDQFKATSFTLDLNAVGYIKNIGIAVTKYAVFGESDYFKTNAYSQTLEVWMYRMMLILAVSCVACLIYWFVKYKRDSKIKLYLVITILTIIVSYVVFQFQYPAFPSMNVRYIIPALVLQLCIVGASTEFFTKKKEGNVLTNVIKVYLVAYASINTLGVLSILWKL